MDTADAQAQRDHGRGVETLRGLGQVSFLKRPLEKSASAFQALTLSAFFKKCVRLGFYPLYETVQFVVLLKRLNIPVRPSQFGLCQQRMNLTVTDAVQHHGLNAAVALGHQVMCVLLTGRNRTVTKRTRHIPSVWLWQGFKLGLNQFFTNTTSQGSGSPVIPTTVMAGSVRSRAKFWSHWARTTWDCP